jgi:hypothetical protein
MRTRFRSLALAFAYLAWFNFAAAAPPRAASLDGSLVIVDAAARAAETRTWTDRAGRQFEGQFIGYDDGQIQVKRSSDGMVFRLPLERFSDADQAFVKSRVQADATPATAEAKPDAGADTAADERPGAGAKIAARTGAGAKPAADAGRPLRVAYFVPADREPEPNYLARLDRVMTSIQTFYRNGMRANGYGPMTFRLDRTPDNQLNIIMVQGKEPTLAYDRESKDKIRGELRAEFARIGLDFEREVVIVFQPLLLREPGQTTELGPFIGGGNGYKGSALVYDDVRLDAALLGSTQIDGFSKGGRTIGDFNTGYIGGAAHELGHAFGLAHDAERPVQRQRFGRSLMARGNHDYGKELRGKGPGAFLSAAAAFPLSIHPLFTGRDLDAKTPEVTIAELSAIPAVGGLTLTGRIGGDPQPVGLVAYNDPPTDPTDYDAVGWPARIKPDGSFRLPIADLMPGSYALRLRVYSENGQNKTFRYSYQVDQFGRPDVSLLKVTN